MVHVPLKSGACRQRLARACHRQIPPSHFWPCQSKPVGNLLVPSRWELWLAGAGGSRDAPGLGCEDLLVQLSAICGKDRFPPISMQGGSNVHVKPTYAWRNRDSKFLLDGCEGLQLCQAGTQPTVLAWHPRGAVKRGGSACGETFL